MLLKNYYTIFAGLTFNSGNMKFVNVSGVNNTYANSNITVNNIGLMHTNINTNSNFSGNGVIFGDGDTPANIDDYKLSGNLITTLSGNGLISCEYVDDKCIATRIFTLTNTGSEDVTIREVATLAGFNYQTIIERTVLDNPVTIPAGGIGQVTYTVCMNYSDEVIDGGNGSVPSPQSTVTVPFGRTSRMGEVLPSCRVIQMWVSPSLNHSSSEPLPPSITSSE